MKRGIFASLLLGVLIMSGCKDDSGPGNSKVFKYSGAIQCEPGSGTSLAAMQRELTDAGIDVICAQTGGDGLNRIQLCGSASGAINIYTIRTANLPDAEALGFASVLTLSEYQDSACR